MRSLTILFLAVITISACKKDDGPHPQPDAAALVFPLQNSECTTGQNLSETLSQVTFEWQDAINADRYTLTVVNLETNVPQTFTTQSTSASLSIEKGAPFSWSVTSTNQSSNLTAVSESWLFYNAGSQITYAPFPAQILSPKPGATVTPNESGEIVLQWSGADVEGDIESYQIFFSEQNPPQDILMSTDATITEISTTVNSGVVYFWKVVTTDAEGNQSDSGVFDFKVF